MNIALEMFVRPVPIEAVIREVQLSKIPSPIDKTLLGKTISVRLEHL